MNFFSDSGTHFTEKKFANLNLYSLEHLGLTCSVGGHGKVQFGIQTQFLLSQLENIETVFCVGAAGGLSGQVSVFDLVLGKKTVEHDYLEKFDPNTDLPSFTAPGNILEKFNGFDSQSFNIHRGIIASGDEDIVHPQRARELFNQTQALAVAWEGAGGARACRFNNKDYLEIRAITDNARDDVSSNFSKNLPQAMKNIAALFEWAFS